jgi:hypothetical protein
VREAVTRVAGKALGTIVMAPRFLGEVMASDEMDTGKRQSQRLHGGLPHMRCQMASKIRDIHRL